MKMYTTPQEGIYTVKTPDYNGGFVIEKTKVWVLGETDKSHLIQLRCDIRGHRGGDRLTVRKHNVSMPHLVRMSSGIGPNDKPIRQYDYSDAYWND